MNITRFNDPFKNPITALFGEKVWDKWSKAPLFIHTYRLDEARRYESQQTELFVPSLPFPSLRLFFQSTDGLQQPVFLAEREDGGWDFVLEVANKAGGETAFFYVGGPQDSISEICMYRYSAWQWVDYHDAEKWKICEGLISAVASLVYQFCRDVMEPRNFIASVAPAREGKSVAWVEARTHYTLITHGHPANSKKVSHGDTVCSDAKAELTRMAHNRRAHYKTLKHSRYRFALNEQRFPDMPKGTIRVKAAWVSPKEWRDAGSRQIYKILEPVSELQAV